MTKILNNAKSLGVNVNSFGKILKIHSFGESHGSAMGAVIDGCPAGLLFDPDLVTKNLQRRRPNQNSLTSSRNEQDAWQVLSGVYDNLTLGTPIAFTVQNKDSRSEDYSEISNKIKTGEVVRPGHADDLWYEKFGHSDIRGGGRASGRETVARVIGGSIAQMIVRKLVPEMKIIGFTESIHELQLEEFEVSEFLKDFKAGQDVESSEIRMPSKEKSQIAAKKLLQAKQEGQSFGGTARIWVDGVPKGLGQPVFNKLKSDLASALMGVGAVNGIEFGAGFKATSSMGTEFHSEKSPVYGGIRGGISTGELIDIRLSFKPTASVLDISKKGRHDPCIIPRAIPVLEAMAQLVLADHLLMKRLDKI